MAVRKKNEAAPVAAEQEQTLIAYKGLDKDFKCRGFQFEVGKTYAHKGEVEACESGFHACESGFHACESPFDVWSYYGPFESRFAVVELGGKLAKHTGDSKVAAARITVTAELTLPDFIKRGIQWLVDATQSSASPDVGTVDSGFYAQIGSSGFYAQIGSSGDAAQIGSSGDYAQIGSSGYSARVGSSGDDARIEATGKDAVVACAGSVVRFRVGKGGCIAIPFSDGKRTRFATLYEGEQLTAGVWYSLDSDGIPKEVCDA